MKWNDLTNLSLKTSQSHSCCFLFPLLSNLLEKSCPCSFFSSSKQNVHCIWRMQLAYPNRSRTASLETSSSAPKSLLQTVDRIFPVPHTWQSQPVSEILPPSHWTRVSEALHHQVLRMHSMVSWPTLEVFHSVFHTAQTCCECVSLLDAL